MNKKKDEPERAPSAPAPNAPAPNVSEHPDAASLESFYRQMTYILKPFFHGDSEEGIERINLFKRDGFDPSCASATGSAILQHIDVSLEFADRFKVGRKRNSVTKETLYIRALCDLHRNENATGLWIKLRLAAQNELDDCPFRFSHDRRSGHKILISSKGRELKRKNFDNRVSEYRIRGRKLPGTR